MLGKLVYQYPITVFAVVGILFIILFFILCYLAYRSYKKSLFNNKVAEEKEYQKEVLESKYVEPKTFDDLLHHTYSKSSNK